MAFLHAKTNYVRPHAKASYIKPLSSCNENGYLRKHYSSNQSEIGGKCGIVPDVDEHGNVGFEKQVKHIESTKESQLLKLNSAHSNLYGEIEKIHSWKTSIELECQQKGKKLNELSQITESQRKVVLDLQMQNENLSLQLDDEIKQRTSVLEKFNSYKELCSVLKKKFQDLQGQFNNSNKLKEAAAKNNEEKIKTVEDLTEKFNKMCLEYSEKISLLSDAWEKEKSNTLLLKDLCEQQSMNADREHKSYCKLIENYQDELKNIFKELENEKLKTGNFEQEKDNLLSRISQMKDMNEFNLKKVNDTEQQLQLLLDSKHQFEDLYKSENIKFHDLSKKYKELEELSNEKKLEYEETITNMNASITNLEHSVIELKLKIKEYESKNEELSISLQKNESEKNSLKNEISETKSEKEKLEEKLLVNAKNSQSIFNELEKENSHLKESLESLKEELSKARLDKENILKLCSENENKLAEITNEYQSAILKIEELGIVEEKYLKLLKDVKELHDNLQLKSELLSSKETEIENLNVLKEKYVESINKIKEMEEALAFNSEQILLKDKEIEELNNISGRNTDDAMKKIKELESEIHTKNELLHSKVLEIEELNIIKEKYDSSLLKIKELEEDILSRSEVLDCKDKMIADFEATVRENEKILDKLEYENIEMKTKIEGERTAVNICLECEIMKDKVREYEDLKNKFMETEQELMNQTQKATDTLKMLSETEDNFDNMRIKKEKEIIKYKDTIQALQHELKLLEIQVGETEKLRTEIEKLEMNIEEITLQNEGDLQRLKTENKKLKSDIETLKTQSNQPLSDVEDKILSGKKHKKSPLHQVSDNEIMEADSSHENTEWINKEATVEISSSAPKRLCKQKNIKITNFQEDKTFLVKGKRKTWGSQSSGSDCLEIIFDKTAQKVTGFTPKRPAAEVKSGTFLSRQLNSVKSNNEKFPTSVDIKEQRRTNNIKTTPSHKNIKHLEKTSANNSDFLSSKENVTVIHLDDSPWLKRKSAIIKGSPTISIQRKFFKTPLKERESIFKTPQLHNQWF